MLGRFFERFGPFLEHVGRNMRSSLCCSNIIFRTHEPTQRGDYCLIAMAHDFKLHVLGGAQPWWLLQAMGCSRAMFPKLW
jgi:hypothetical protein